MCTVLNCDWLTGDQQLQPVNVTVPFCHAIKLYHTNHFRIAVRLGVKDYLYPCALASLPVSRCNDSNDQTTMIVYVIVTATP